MIVRENERFFVLTPQDDHARLSGEIAKRMHANLYGNSPYVQEALLAIAEHDRSWMRLDDTPVWNDRDRRPFSFMDYPHLPKLTFYRLGVDEVEAMSAYAGLLCSLHFSSFQPPGGAQDPAWSEFVDHERARQRRIRAVLNEPEEASVMRHLGILQLCDQISLYVCFNEPGAAKADEHPWYREGFGVRLDGRQLSAAWTGPERVRISPSPFAEPFRAVLRTKHVLKDAIAGMGIGDAYRETPWTEQTLHFE
ncbi:DUF3891 family protein [Cohnella nanjingensis]|uniref:DUF3891 family protein n=1 Tax=Cohnella nanjingensis TaxID=1387779 RepID=A0A7X0RVD2_9BACL|nr:DUF3891 family protein [Cohnella nanjingensis]MBB6672799.1 DUF3891 family protein [Cohnella nanjingensis]